MRPLGKRHIAGALLSVSALAGSPCSATAQPVFVESGMLVDHDPTLRSDTMTTIGVSGGVGMFLTRRLSLRLEFDLPPWHASHQSGRARLPHRIEVHSIREENRAPSLGAVRQLLDDDIIRHVGRARSRWPTSRPPARCFRWRRCRSLQPGRPRQRGCACLLRRQQYRLHSLVSARCGAVRPTRWYCRSHRERRVARRQARSRSHGCCSAARLSCRSR